ncbi:hypothetical protein AMECASPLE_024913 [Ameca splendens]|uniref:Uncharacterized protein n=1 Tax=Ameca splendens TaxID=208324 RepID=A0ABV0ZEB4_9TELE
MSLMDDFNKTMSSVELSYQLLPHNWRKRCLCQPFLLYFCFCVLHSNVGKLAKASSPFADSSISPSVACSHKHLCLNREIYACHSEKQFPWSTQDFSAVFPSFERGGG